MWEAVLPESLLARAAIAYVYSLIAATWMYYTARKSAPGLSRLVWALPVVLTELAVAPVLVDPVRWPILPTPVSGIFGLAAFKVAAYIMGRGPLVLVDHAAFMEFAAVMCMPVIPAVAFKTSGGYTDPSLLKNRPMDFIASYGRKSCLSICAIVAMQLPFLPRLAHHWLYAFNLSLFLGCLWDVWCLAATVFMGLKVASSFDAPWLSTSFADYWARRWNLTVCYMLRVLVYEPVIEGRFVAAPTSNTPAAAPAPRIAAAAGPGMPVAEDAAAPQGSPPSSPGSTCDAVMRLDDTTDAADVDAGEGIHKGVESAALRRRHNALVSKEDGMISMQNGASAASSADKGTDVTAAGAGAAEAAAAAAARRVRPSLLRRYLATQATFAFSGAWHALIWWTNMHYMDWMGWRWFWFFTIQAPIVAAESIIIRKAKKRGLLLPTPVAVVLTNFLLIVVASPLLFGPCDWSGMCPRMMGNVKEVILGMGWAITGGVQAVQGLAAAAVKTQ